MSLQALLHKTIGRLMQRPARRRVLVEQECSNQLADLDAGSDDTLALRPLQSAARAGAAGRAVARHAATTKFTGRTAGLNATDP